MNETLRGLAVGGVVAGTIAAVLARHGIAWALFAAIAVVSLVYLIVAARRSRAARHDEPRRDEPPRDGSRPPGDEGPRDPS